MRSLRSLCVLALLALLTTAATCEGPRPLDLDDENRFTPAGRASFEILPGNDQRRRGSALDLVTGSPAKTDENAAPPGKHRVQGTLSVVGEIAHATGHDQQFVASGDDVRLGGLTVVGPTTVHLKAKSMYGHVAGRGGIRIIDMFSLEAIAGLGVDHTEMELERPGGADGTDGEIKPGFLFGGRATIRPIPLFDLFLQYTIDMMGAFDSQARDLQGGVDLNLTRNVSVFAGYHSYRFYEDHSSASNVRIHLEGPMAGVSLKF